MVKKLKKFISEKGLVKYDYINYFSFLFAMTAKEIKARYKNAALGFLWILLNPLAQMVVIGLVFQNFIRVPIKNYYLFLFPGLLAWNFFNYSLSKVTPSIVYERNLIQKAKFPREAIPISIILSNYTNFLISIFLLLLYLFFSDYLRGNYFQFGFVKLVLFIISLLWLLLFTCGLSLLTSSLNVKYRDINFLIQALTILWFYATPIIYTVSMLPGRYYPLFFLNPITFPFEMLRSSLINTPLPHFDLLLFNFGETIIISILGVIVFYKNSNTFSDWL